YLSKVSESHQFQLLMVTCSGKTTIPYRLQVGEFITVLPYTQLASMLKLIRPCWWCYSNTDAVIYVLKKAILVVFANKQDMEQAMTPTKVVNSPGFPALGDTKWESFKTTVTKGTKLDEHMLHVPIG
uniref:Uncharacterized protein n=1 Tax=Erpetoichthys calabaricus TaxID=27687 RepID=A0A8C4XC86_ERPCA